MNNSTRTLPYFNGGLLCKIARIEHLRQLQKGFLHMNRLDYYTKNEHVKKQSGAVDSREGMAAQNITVLFEAAGKKLTLKNAYIRVLSDKPIFCCMQMNFSEEIIQGKKYAFTPDPRLITDFASGEQSEYGILIFGKDDFKIRFIQAAERQKLIYAAAKVKYQDCDNPKDFMAPANQLRAIFRKDPIFAYQNEYRLFLQKTIQAPLDFYIGDISDISYLLELNLLRNNIYLEIK